MTTFVETPIPSPYVVGAEFRIQVSPPDGMSYETQATVTHVFAPVTISPVMKVSLAPRNFSHSQQDLPSELVFKVYDRRFGASFRAFYGAKPATYESESAYRQYVRSGNAPKGLDAITEARNTNYFRRLGDGPPNLLEHMLAARIAPYFGSECAAYKRLVSLQGKYIPRFYGSTRFLGKSHSSIEPLDPSVPGVLLEFVAGINLDKLAPTSSGLDTLIHSAFNIVELYSEMGVLNDDVRLENFIVKPGGTELVMIDFAQSRLRGQKETDEEWKRAKWNADEEGCIGYSASWKFKWNYVPTYKYLVMAEDDY